MNVSFCCDLQWQVLKDYILLQAVIHSKQNTKRSKKISFLMSALTERTEAQIQQTPYANSFYHVHIIKLS